MSLQAISWALDLSSAGGNDRLVLIVMAHHTDDVGFCGLSKATLADETHLSESTVMRAQQQLTQLTEIEPILDGPNAPAWWRAIPVNRRPKLFRMTGFLGSQYATPIHRRAGVSKRNPSPDPGVSLGCRGGVTEVHDTPPDLHVSDVNREQRISNYVEPVENISAADPECPRCQGRGEYFSAGAGVDVACPCTYERALQVVT